MSEFMENQCFATMYQVEIIIDILVKNNLVTKEAFQQMLEEKLNNTLMEETEKSAILSLIK